MFKIFERKMTKVEFDNTMKELHKYFHDNENAVCVFSKLMEYGSCSWSTGRFTNTISLIYKTNAHEILSNVSFNNEFYNSLKEVVEQNEGKDKTYFIYINYHKAPCEWRLSDMQCVYGSVHPSYQPLIGQYQNILKSMKLEKERQISEQKKRKEYQIVSKYVDF